jgi:hypothetical protein
MHNKLTGVLAATLLLVTLPAFADTLDITIYNATGYGIKYIGINPPGDDDWDDDDNELTEVLKDGENVHIKFDEGDKGCTWQIKIDWELPGYSSPLIPSVNLCNIKDLRLTYDKATGTTSYQTR